jgi:hypothetical protein
MTCAVAAGRTIAIANGCARTNAARTVAQKPPQEMQTQKNWHSGGVRSGAFTNTTRRLPSMTRI